MDTSWIVGAVLCVAYFAYFETRAFLEPTRQDTLSRFIATMGKRWPPSIWLWGFAIRFLTAHFFWAWPQNPLAGGG